MSDSISVIVGNGELPEKVLKNLRSKGFKVDIIGIRGEYNRDLEKYANRFESIRFYELDRGIDVLKSFGNKYVMFVGGITKISLINMFDVRTIKSLIKLNSLSDENIFKGIINLVNKSGFKVIGFTNFYEEGIVKNGLICGIAPDDSLINDALYGMNFIKHNSMFSIGQAAIVKNENIIAVETIFGTDYILSNYKKGSIKDPIFVKCSKEGQDERIDLPSIGKKTIDILYKVDIRWVFLEADRSVIIGDKETIDYARKRGINICGIKLG